MMEMKGAEFLKGWFWDLLGGENFSELRVKKKKKERCGMEETIGTPLLVTVRSSWINKIT